MNNPVNPCKGEIWLVNFDPVVGDEIAKQRPAVVVNENAMGLLKLRIIVPIIHWEQWRSNHPWYIKLTPDGNNCLKKVSGVDAIQIKSLSCDRFSLKIGRVSSSELRQILDTIALCIGI